jgi:hypothetical protein
MNISLYSYTLHMDKYKIFLYYINLIQSSSPWSFILLVTFFPLRFCKRKKLALLFPLKWPETNRLALFPKQHTKHDYLEVYKLYIYLSMALYDIIKSKEANDRIYDILLSFFIFLFTFLFSQRFAIN